MDSIGYHLLHRVFHVQYVSTRTHTSFCIVLYCNCKRSVIFLRRSCKRKMCKKVTQVCLDFSRLLQDQTFLPSRVFLPSQTRASCITGHPVLQRTLQGDFRQGIRASSLLLSLMVLVSQEIFFRPRGIERSSPKIFFYKFFLLCRTTRPTVLLCTSLLADFFLYKLQPKTFFIQTVSIVCYRAPPLLCKYTNQAFMILSHDKYSCSHCPSMLSGFFDCVLKQVPLQIFVHYFTVLSVQMSQAQVLL